MATKVWLAANEKHAESDITYRAKQGDDAWAQAMDDFFGPTGNGGVDNIPFPHRDRREHGPWSFEASKEKRAMQSGSVYLCGGKVSTMANNVYTVLAKKILGCANKDGGTESLPSGWTDSQPLLHLVMYNLYMKSEANRDEEEEGKEAEEDDEEVVRISRACKARDDPELRELRYLGRTFAPGGVGFLLTQDHFHNLAQGAPMATPAAAVEIDEDQNEVYHDSNEELDLPSFPPRSDTAAESSKNNGVGVEDLEEFVVDDAQGAAPWQAAIDVDDEEAEASETSVKAPSKWSEADLVHDPTSIAVSMSKLVEFRKNKHPYLMAWHFFGPWGKYHDPWLSTQPAAKAGRDSSRKGQRDSHEERKAGKNFVNEMATTAATGNGPLSPRAAAAVIVKHQDKKAELARMDIAAKLHIGAMKQFEADKGQAKDRYTTLAQMRKECPEAVSEEDVKEAQTAYLAFLSRKAPTVQDGLDKMASEGARAAAPDRVPLGPRPQDTESDSASAPEAMPS